MASPNRVWRSIPAVAVLLCGLAAAAAAVGDREAVYYGGVVSPAFQRGHTNAFPPGYYGHHLVPGRLDTSSDADLVFDAGRKGSLVIPWTAIVALGYGPHRELGTYRSPDPVADRLRQAPWYPMGGPLAYPWSDPYHDFDKHHYVTLELDDDGGTPGKAVFELGKDIVRPTLDALERRTGRKVIVGTLGACAAYKGRDACGWGSPAELKGRTKVFIDTTGSPEPNQATPILAAIEDAHLGVTVVPSASEADIILAFRCAPGTKLMPSKTEPHTRAVGEVYVSQGGTLRVLLLFDEEWFYWKPKLPVKFAREFVKAYKAANGLR
jgi:hypothetical protein